MQICGVVLLLLCDPKRWKLPSYIMSCSYPLLCQTLRLATPRPSSSPTGYEGRSRLCNLHACGLALPTCKLHVGAKVAIIYGQHT